MVNTRNILLIGKTGNGKSALANVITGTNKFREGGYTVSGTKRIQTEEFEYQGVKYRIIDTVGISDTTEGTKMSLEKVLYNLAKVGYVVKDGLSQILLLMDEMSEEQTILLYDLLKKTVFDDNIAQYTTIVRTKFVHFEDEEECSKDKQSMSERGGEFREVIDRGKIIHVDNPPVDISGEGKRVELQKELNKEARKISREILLKNLETYESIYRPLNLNNLNKILDEKWKDKEILKEEISKEFIKYIREKGSSLEKELKDELEKERSKIEEKITQLEEGKLDRKMVEESKSYGHSSSDWRYVSEKRKKRDNSSAEEKSQGERFQTKVNLQSKLRNQVVRELKELNSYLPENEKFVEWKKKINQLKEEKMGETERKLVSEINVKREEIIEILKEIIEEKKNCLQKEKDNLEKNLLSNVKEKVVGSVSKFFGGGKQEKNLAQENLEKICQAQASLTESEVELKTVKKILERIENYKEQLDQQLEAKVEVLSK